MMMQKSSKIKGTVKHLGKASVWRFAESYTAIRREERRDRAAINAALWSNLIMNNFFLQSNKSGDTIELLPLRRAKPCGVERRRGAAVYSALPPAAPPANRVVSFAKNDELESCGKFKNSSKRESISRLQRGTGSKRRRCCIQNDTKYQHFYKIKILGV